MLQWKTLLKWNGILLCDRKEREMRKSPNVIIKNTAEQWAKII